MSLPALAQTVPERPLPENFVAAGMAWNQYANPQVSGTLLYAKKANDSGTYSFSMVDVISKSEGQFSTATSISTGFAQHVLDFGKVRVFAVTTVGVLAGGDNIGYSWTGGGCFTVGLGKGWSLMPSVRVLKSSLTDFQPVIGVAIGFGK